MEFSLDKVLEACSKTTGIANPNINYVNKVLVNWYEERTGKDKSGKRKELTLTEISQYYEHCSHKEEKEAEAHRREVYVKVPRIKQIDDELAAGSRELSRIIISDTVDKMGSLGTDQRDREHPQYRKSVPPYRQWIRAGLYGYPLRMSAV